MLNKLSAWLSSEQEDKSVFDIVLYGSTVKGKQSPRDIDIVVIFRTGTLKDRLAKLQKMKKKIPTEINVDMKTILIEELFQERFFARSGIFLEGISIFDKIPFAQKIGFDGKAIFFYSLKRKTHTEKIKLNYILTGRGGPGMIERLQGERLAPGVVEVPIRHALEFETILEQQHVHYEKKQTLMQR